MRGMTVLGSDARVERASCANLVVGNVDGLRYLNEFYCSIMYMLERNETGM